MPNWASVTYKCVGSPKEVGQLHSALKEIEQCKTTLIKNGFGKWWLGNLVVKLGGDWEKYRCRGEITDFDLDADDCLTIWMETAWCEQEGVREIIEQTFRSITVFYIEEEPGCGVYCTNDRSRAFFTDRYFLDSSEDTDYFSSIESAAERVAEIVGHVVDLSVEAMQKALNEYVERQNKPNLFYCLHEFEIVDD